ncbi:hypothetical protein [Spirochaeta cellobiosiphila]|uniref:hypothetical protein n=1 Tax=Spirochaeta cellobiosiphila TaxID=504483 RepID=UPI0003FAEEE3|nr:hypothetical protein [Spirochaeta cellobiosiphila]
MIKNYHIDIDFPDEEELQRNALEFAERFKKNRNDISWFFQFDNRSELNHAIDFLKKQDFNWDFYYRLSISNKEITEYPAYFPGFFSNYHVLLSNQVDSRIIQKKDIFIDLTSGKLILSSRTKELFQAHLKNIAYEQIIDEKGNIYFTAEIKKYLTAPVDIPIIQKLSNPTALANYHLVASDGRYFLKEDASKEITNHGIAFYSTIRHKDRCFKVKPRLIISNRFIDILIKEKTKGVNLNRLTVILSEKNENIL